MDGWMDGWKDGKMERRIDGRKDGQMQRWIDGQLQAFAIVAAVVQTWGTLPKGWMQPT